MDAFFASVTLLKFPQLVGQPVVIGGPSAGVVSLHSGPPESWPLESFARLHHYRGRGVISTCTYEARALGLRSGQGLMKAARHAPEAVLLPAEFELYRHYSRLFKQALLEHVEALEDRGIDEVYLDLGHHADVLSAVGMARLLQQSVLEATGGLGCSVGLGSNKLLAKLVSDWDKPLGITPIQEHEIPTRVWPLPCRQLGGIGAHTEARLKECGIHTLGELAATDLAKLRQHFGARTASWLHHSAWGRDERVLSYSTEPKSISRETTFGRDLHHLADRHELNRVFVQLCQRLSLDLQRKGYAARRVGIKLVWADFSRLSREVTLDTATADPLSLRRAAVRAFHRVDYKQKIRLMGLRLGELSKR